MSKKETFTVIISVQSRQRETFRSHRSCNGTNLYVYSLPLFFFITVIKNAATQRGGGAKTRAGGNYRLETEVQR